MKIDALDHIVLCVEDIERALSFYSDLLGMEVREERPEKWSLHFGAQKISLQAVSEAPPIARGTTPGSGNFCLLTETPVGEVASLLQRAGVEVLEGPGERLGATGRILSVYFRDPAGNLVEISNRL